MKSPFNTDHHPTVGEVETLAEGLQVVTAPNAGPMTFTGTRSYILGESEAAVIDPGPDDPAHLAALERALDGRTVSHILVTHSHVDHSPLAARLGARFDAPVYGFGAADAARAWLMEKLAQSADLGGGEGIDNSFRPDILLADGERIAGNGWSLEAIHTPGHLSNHLCFAWAGQGSLFSGDHVMGWASTLISPPDGDLTAFMESLRKLQNRSEDTYYCGHGAPLREAQTMVEYLLAHRFGREEQIRGYLAEAPRDVRELTAIMYSDVDPRLHGAASRNVLAHLIDLYARGLVTVDGEFSATARFFAA